MRTPILEACAKDAAARLLSRANSPEAGCAGRARLDARPEASGAGPFARALPFQARLARAEAGFTLIEIMVVVVIIGLLLTVVASNVTKQLGTAETVKSRADIQGIETALATYRLDNGFYPTTEQGLEALVAQPGGEPAPHNWNGPYLKGHASVPKDRWGNEYLYLSPGVHNAESYDVWTRGQDGQDGGEGPNSDIGNWQSEPGEGQPSAAQ